VDKREVIFPKMVFQMWFQCSLIIVTATISIDHFIWFAVCKSHIISSTEWFMNSILDTGFHEFYSFCIYFLNPFFNPMILRLAQIWCSPRMIFIFAVRPYLLSLWINSPSRLAVCQSNQLKYFDSENWSRFLTCQGNLSPKITLLSTQ